MTRCHKTCFLLLLLIIPAVTLAKNPLSRNQFSLDLGIWKPGSLDKHPSRPFENVEGGRTCWGFSYTTPSWQDFAFRVSIFQWGQNFEKQSSRLASVTLRHLSLELKNAILQQSTISPFVSFGAAAIWSREVPTGGQSGNIPLDRAGFGGNVGAGLDIIVAPHLAIAVEYQYLYARFEKNVGLTEVYSGPKISLRIGYRF